jgi:hypothetical protein
LQNGSARKWLEDLLALCHLKKRSVISNSLELLPEYRTPLSFDREPAKAASALVQQCRPTAFVQNISKIFENA